MVCLLMKKPPALLTDCQKFACCYQYRDYHCCIYLGGGSNTDHDMYWGFAIYNSSEQLHCYDQLSNCLDVDDGMNYCQYMIDYWLKPLDYEEIRLWRDICEYLGQWEHTTYHPTDPWHIEQKVPGSKFLLCPNRTRRQLLWEKYTIQLIKWEVVSKHHSGWCLKGNWEDKIDFLEQVYVLDRDPETIPKRWLEKWEAKQRSKRISEIRDTLTDAIKRLERIEGNFLGRAPWYSLDEEFERRWLQQQCLFFKSDCKKAKELIFLYYSDLARISSGN